MLLQIKPCRILVLFLLVGVAASLTPTQPKAAGVMTPFHRTVSGLYGS